MGIPVIREPAPAKVNLFLRVLGRRDDGYHEIETLIQPITLADGVQARPGDGLRLAVGGERAGEVPTGEENLVLRAALALRAACPEAGGARLLLVKRVPAAAGLGGGSADAAATLRALDDLWGCGLGRAGLEEVAAGVGSDVPALVGGGPALARGRGEKVEPVALPRTWWAVVLLPFGIRAAEAYAWWDADGETGPEAGPFLGSLSSGGPDRVGPLLFNDLEPPVCRRHPQVARAREALLEAGALGAVMCGSGPTVAGLARDGPHAEALAAATGGMAVASVGTGDGRPGLG